MKLFFTGTFQYRPEQLLQRCGYGRAPSRVPSFQKRVGPLPFPRFHVYIDPTPDGFRINLHLDQKAACYTGTTAHSGEYDGELVEREGERIRSIVEGLRVGKG